MSKQCPAYAAAALLVALTTGAVAAPARRIADLWYAHNAMLVMLGGSNQVVLTVATPKAQPWMFRVAPRLSRARTVANGPANAETLLAAKVDLAFVAQRLEAARLTRLGVPAQDASFTDVASMRASLRRTAAAVGTPLARGRAAAYEVELDATLATLDGGLRGVPADHRPRVLHLASLSPLRADGADTLIDSWIRLAGGRNAASGLHGNLQPISSEQIARWNPDIVIVGGPAAARDDRPWTTIPSLRTRRVVRNPIGVFPWDRYGPEFVLQLQWAAKLLHPTRFAALDTRHATIDFYRRFFSYKLTDDDAARIQAAMPPAAAPR